MLNNRTCENLAYEKIESRVIQNILNLNKQLPNHICMNHQRCSSGKMSPYQDQSILIKLKLALKTLTRKQSPNSTVKPKKIAEKSATLSYPKTKLLKPNKQKKPPIKAKKKPNKSLSHPKLKILDKKHCKKAPKIFENQIFCDIYDGKGNHDRVMDTFDVSESRTRVEDDTIPFAKFIVAHEIETEPEEIECKSRIKPPENSFFAESDKKSKGDHLALFTKLHSLAKHQKNSKNIDISIEDL